VIDRPSLAIYHDVRNHSSGFIIMSETNLDGGSFQVQVLSNGIHEIRWQTTERQAVDAWMDYNDMLYAKHNADDILCYLHVMTSAKFPPVTYVVRKAQQLQTKYPEQPSTRSAILFPSRFFAGFINTLSALLNRKGKDITRVFGMDERDKAIAWLLEKS
jgi:hypothetical protein